MKPRIAIFLSFALIFADQFSKYIIRTSGGFYFCNKNIAFGLAIPSLIFWLAWLTIIVLLFFALYKKYCTCNTLPVILVLAGAISNAIDRLCFGCVIDFIDFKIWPLFNLADCFIVVGVIMLSIKYFFKSNVR